MNVWEATIDGAAWAARVEGTDDPYKGVLILADATGAIVHRETVGLAYGARFGPDVQDVADWQERIIDLIDHPEKRNS